MGFVEEVSTRIDETLAQKIEFAEEELERLKEAKTRCVERAADSKLELLVLRRSPAGPTNPERLARESGLQTSIRDAREQYMKVEQDIEAITKDLGIYRGIKSDLQNGALQMIA